ncbi:unnamed protein product [Sphagnum troendelagicum]
MHVAAKEGHGPPKTPNPSTYAMKKTGALLLVRNPRGFRSHHQKRDNLRHPQIVHRSIMNCSADSAITKVDDALSDGIFMAALMSRWWG